MFARTLCRRTAGQARSWNSHAPIMPLRAKVTSPAFVAQAKMSTNAEGKSDDIDEPEDVLFNSIYGLRTIELNRPSKLHSLNGSMIRKIIPRLQEWTKSDMANVIVIKGSGPKAFCAGGDVAKLAQWNMTGPEGQQKSIDFFALEYKMNHLIATYQKPYIAFMDGITMGGGVGLSVHAPFRIATERTLFAMPETTIGFFPDVGASFFLPRMPGAVGTYLALTSERLAGVNAFYAGIATHYIHSTTLPALESRLSELRFKDYHTLAERLPLIDSTIEEFCSGLPHDQPMHIAGALRQAIDRCFSKSDINEILEALEAEVSNPENPEELQKWAEKTIKTLHERSPTSVVTTLRQMQVGKDWGIRHTFFREHQMVGKFMKHHDFTEGVSSLLISKPRRTASWQPASLSDLTPSTAAEIATEMITPDESLKPIELHGSVSDSGDWKEYPWRKFGIPSEEEVEKVWTGIIEEKGELKPWKSKVLAVFAKERRGKQGVKEVVTEILERNYPVWSAGRSR